MKFHVLDEGDMSVGIPGIDCVVEFPDVYRDGYCEEDIVVIKDFLLSFYDAQAVLTETEYEKHIEMMNSGWPHE